MSVPDTPPEARTAQEVLMWSSRATESALREAARQLPASMRRIAGYHLGWWDVDGTPTTGSGGKALRGALALLSAEASGGDPGRATGAAMAVELVHNFSLLHDDVIDGDETRRHRTAAWRAFGTADAIIAGDALLSLAVKVVADRPPAVERITGCVIELCGGQHADIAFERRTDVAVDECTEMARGKTGALFGCAGALGALSAGAGADVATGFDDFGRHLGIAYQFVDDILGIWGDPATTGKPAYSDLAARKKSLPVVTTLNSGHPAGREFARRYNHEPADADDLASLAGLIEDTGARQWARRRAGHHLLAATRSLERVAAPSRGRTELLALAHFAVDRDH
ncbi:geranylgeranyl diphosphate synthase type I [Saccharothrix tamanrassetensis]|uniref:Geranylgeranyl diphosphate synthase type I n=1 Tax=Saccharothrix tamanrassetensis TaxID=1051531 RepID=A0A841CV59_9PSEU|nr:polyprenyl synthetase family protein [Saccharothrix tamanrassetensis]MBB5960713.1 geranylgeranyl diphosphate synthase type I [Saccharothrix tamanrassetensis]